MKDGHEFPVHKNPIGPQEGISPTKGLIGREGPWGEGKGTGNSQDRAKMRRRYGHQRNSNSTLTELDGLTPPHSDMDPRTNKRKIRPGKEGVRGKIPLGNRQKMTLPEKPKKGNQTQSPKGSLLAIQEVELGVNEGKDIHSDGELGNGRDTLGTLDTLEYRGKEPVVKKWVREPHLTVQETNKVQINTNRLRQQEPC